MLFVTGGAYSGKRRYIRSRESNLWWHSAYENRPLDDWLSAWKKASEASAVLVLEGWERWIADDVREGLSPQAIREKYKGVLFQLKQLEQESTGLTFTERPVTHRVALLMLEMGRGIVPLLPHERSLRDIAGWVQQDAAAWSDEAIYIWHGLSRTMK